MLLRIATNHTWGKGAQLLRYRAQMHQYPINGIDIQKIFLASFYF